MLDLYMGGCQAAPAAIQTKKYGKIFVDLIKKYIYILPYLIF